MEWSGSEFIAALEAISLLTPLVIPLHARKSHISYESVFIFTSVTMSSLQPEMQKVADAADISVLFFSAGANF